MYMVCCSVLGVRDGLGVCRALGVWRRPYGVLRLYGALGLWRRAGVCGLDLWRRAVCVCWVYGVGQYVEATPMGCFHSSARQSIPL